MYIYLIHFAVQAETTQDKTNYTSNNKVNDPSMTKKCLFNKTSSQVSVKASSRETKKEIGNCVN